MGFRNQFLVLSWKNFTLRRRQPVRQVVEILLPLCLFLFLVFDRFQFNKDLRISKQECHYNPRAMPSAGTIPFVQSYVCELYNQCNHEYYQSKPGVINYYNSSLIGTVFNFVEEFLTENIDPDFASNLDEELQLINKVTSLIKSQPDLFGNLLPSSQSMDLESLQKLALNKTMDPSSVILTLLENANGPTQKTNISSNIKQIQNSLRMAANLMQGLKDNADAADDVFEGICDNQLLQNILELRFPGGVKSICEQSSGNRTALLKDLMGKLNTTDPSSEAARLFERITKQTSFPTVAGLLQVINNVRQSPMWTPLLESLQSLIGDVASSKQPFNWYKFSRHLFCAAEKKAPQADDTMGNGDTQLGNKENHDSSKIRVDVKSLKAVLGVIQAYEKSSQHRTCADFFSSLESNSATRPFWHQIKSIALGKILYTPDSPAAQKIIKEASRTFDSIHSFQRLASALATVLPSIQGFLENHNDYLKELLDIDLFKSIDDDSSYSWVNALNDTTSLLSSSSFFFTCFPLNKFVPYPDEESLVNASVKLHKNRTFWAAIVLDNINSSTQEVPSTIKYRIRMMHYRVDRTTYIEDQYWHPGPRDYPPTDLRYFLYGFIYIQDMIEHAIIRLQTNVSQEPGVYTQQMPYPCWTFDRFVFVVSWNLPLFVVVSWIYSVAMIIKGIVYEKEMRLKEVMKMMGLGNGVHWLAWFFNAFVIMLITITALCIILKHGAILEYSDPSILFIFLLSYVVSTISLCFLISVFFNKANLAAVCGGIIFFILFLPYTQLVQWEQEMSTGAKMAACLVSNIAMGYGCHYIALHEAQALGIHWHNIDESPLPEDTFNLQTCIIMMFLDTFIYLILTWYIEAVFPGQYGMPRKWYFPLQKSYWLGGCGKTAEVESTPVEDVRRNSPNFEEEPPGSVIGVKVRNLRKVYKGGKVAVDGLSINFYENQITSFLGHNGAGKTTTMSILTGLFPPTSGTAYIYGKNVLTSMDEIRRDLGMCPQHNVLFDLLTVEEHIWFYSRLKGQTEAEIKVELKQMVHDVGLPRKQKEKSKYLSGGMKRKLSVAIAFVGGSKTVILDEPTAGVDPYARRAIWELLLKLKKGRTIILSTHHMDEADVLGDRIAIISRGRVRTVGSSMFLKERFANGYYLTLAKQEALTEMGLKDENARERSRSHSASCSGQFSTTAVVHRVENTKPVVDPCYHDSDAEDEGFDERRSRETSSSSLPSVLHGNILTRFHLPKLTSFIKQFVPNAELVEDNSMEVCFRLPESFDHAVKLENLFKALEHSHTNLGISSYGISHTSLEEVFFKTTDDDDDELIDCSIQDGPQFDEESEQLLILDDVDENVDDKIAFSEAKNEKMKGKLLKAWQFTALIIKRFHHVRRSKKGFLSEIILPSALVCIAMIISNIWPPVSEMPPLELQPWMYEPHTGSDSSLNVFYSNDNPYSEFARILEAEFLQSPFYGTRCMNPHQHSIAGKPCLQKSKVNSAWTHVKSNISHTATCSCNSGFQQCSKGAEGPKPSHCELLTNDILLNLTARNLTDWLVKTNDQYLKRRYGGFSFGQESIFGRLNASQVLDVIRPLIQSAKENQSIFYGSEKLWKNLGAVMKSAFVRDNAKVWFNNVGWAADVSYMNGLNNLILRSFLPPEKDPKDYGIVAINHPLEPHRDHFAEKKMDWVDFTVSMCIIFALSFVPASFVLFLIEERVSNSKHLQFLSGINPTIYWMANSVWDYMNYTIPALICILILLAFDNDAYTSAKHFPCLVVLLLLYGWAINPMMYPFSRVFSVASSAFVALSCFNMFVGFFTTIVTFILDFFQQEDEDLVHLNNIFKKVFLVFPHYCLGRGLLDLASLKLQSDFYARFDKEFEYDLYDWNVIGRNIFAMTMMGVFFVIFNLLIEYKFLLSGLFVSRAPVWKLKNEDIDVTKERQRVSSGGAANDILRLEGLTKAYRAPGRKGKLTAVDHLYVGVPKGQCFGLLGVNGAGKTTTFKMLTGDVNVSDGDAYVNQYSVPKDMIKASEHIGYCPQFDAIDPLLTARELLEFYARVRGVYPSQVKHTAHWAIRKLGLLPHADKISSSCSGGNKRKLSTAIALIGNPPLIFLDEPTTGMDPKAKRFLWDRINNMVKTGHSVILTSHSMEECEALCSRLAIMVNGSFQCIGSIQHLKNRFGNGYSIVLRVGGHQPDLTPVMDFITSCFSSAKLIEKHHNMLQYQLGTEGLSLSRLFHVMEEAKEKHGVESYSVSQTTLDQVFINFAKKQADMLDYELLEDTDDNVFHNEENSRPRHQGHSSADNSDDEISDFDDQSLAGSTIQLIRPSRGRRGNSRNELPSVNDIQSYSIL